MKSKRWKRSKAHFFRYAFRTRDIYEMPKNNRIENQYRQELEVEYQRIKLEILNDSECNKNYKYNDLFVISVGLFAYGRLDVAEDILDNFPCGKASINHLAGVLTSLLPLPHGYLPFRNPEEIEEWLKVKSSRLRWDETLERYVLETFKILSNFPANSSPKNFTASEGITQQ